MISTVDKSVFAKDAAPPLVTPGEPGDNAVVGGAGERVDDKHRSRAVRHAVDEAIGRENAVVPFLRS